LFFLQQEGRREQLKDAHKAGDTAAIDSAIAALNNAWQVFCARKLKGR
jgi:molecular chaperone DnaK